MTEITPEQKNKLLSAAEIVDKGDLAVLTKILEFQDFLESYKDDKEQMDTVLSKVEELRTACESCMTADNVIIEKVNNALSSLETSIKTQINDSQGVSEGQLQTFKDSFDTQLQDIKSSIPSMPDLSFYADRLNEIEQKIPEIKETILDTPVEVRDKLETLKGDERLDRSAIKGLEAFIDQPTLDRAIAILDQRTQYLLNKTSTVVSTGGVGSGVSSFNGRTGDVLLNSADVTNALGYTPFNWSGFTQGSVLFANGSSQPTQDNANFFYDATNHRLGLLTAAPTHTLTLGSTGNGFAYYNTTDQTTNYERGVIAWTTNVLNITTVSAGTGTLRDLALGNTNRTFKIAAASSSGGGYQMVGGTTANAGATGMLLDYGSSATSGTFVLAKFTSTITQTTTGGYTGLLLNITESTTGSGTKLLQDLQVGGVSRFNVSNTGLTTITQNALGVTTTDAILLNNTTAAALGAQQISPSLHFSGNGWSTTSSASQSVDYRINILPIQGTTNPTGSLQIQSSINGAAFGNIMTISTTGTIIPGLASSNNLAYGSVGTSNFVSYNQNLGVGTTTASYLFGGAGTSMFRTALGGGISTVPMGVSNNYANVIIAGSGVTTGPSGTNPWVASLAVIAPIITGGGATLTNAATVYIEGAPTGATNNYALYLNTGVTYMGGFLGVGIATPRTGLDVVFSVANGGTLSFQNTSTTGYTAVDLYDSTGFKAVGFGLGNSGVGNPYKGNFYFGTNASTSDLVFLPNSVEVLRASGATGNVVTFSTSIAVPKTITASGTNGAQTINKMSGSVNFATAATSLVVTNSLVTTSSVIILTIGTNDSLMTSATAVAGSGSFTIFPNSAPAAATRVNFLVTN